MTAETPTNQKMFYGIGEVSKMLGVNASLLRFWETEFPTLLKPHKNKKGNRSYTPEDIELLRRIYHLTRDCGMTLEGVRQQLRLEQAIEPGAISSEQQVIDTLRNMRAFLVELKSTL